jgi:hypothetical protein
MHNNWSPLKLEQEITFPFTTTHVKRGDSLTSEAMGEIGILEFGVDGFGLCMIMT